MTREVNPWIRMTRAMYGTWPIFIHVFNCLLLFVSGLNAFVEVSMNNRIAGSVQGHELLQRGLLAIGSRFSFLLHGRKEICTSSSWVTSSKGKGSEREGTNQRSIGASSFIWQMVSRDFNYIFLQCLRYWCNHYSIKRVSARNRPLKIIWGAGFTKCNMTIVSNITIGCFSCHTSSESSLNLATSEDMKKNHQRFHGTKEKWRDFELPGDTLFFTYEPAGMFM